MIHTGTTGKTHDSPSSINAALRTLHQPLSLGQEIFQAGDNLRPLCPTSEELHAIQVVMVKSQIILLIACGVGAETHGTLRTFLKGILLSTVLSFFFF